MSTSKNPQATDTVDTPFYEGALPPDYHTHTCLCRHADGVPLEYAAVAQRMGVPHIAVTDHCPTDDGFGVGHRMELAEFGVYLRIIEYSRVLSSVPILLGIEADYYPGCERFLGEWLERHPFDIVLGSVHFLNYWGHPTEPQTLGDARDPEEIWSLYFKRVGQLAETRLYDVVAHLDLPKRYLPPLPEARLRELALPALDKIAEAGMAIEINTVGRLLPVGECHPSLSLLTWARERGIGLTFGSDAHTPERVGDGFVEALALARAAGYTTSRHFQRRSFVEVPLPNAGQSEPVELSDASGARGKGSRGKGKAAGRFSQTA